MRIRLAVSATVLAVAVAACSDRSPPTSTSTTPVGPAPLAVISDAAHGGGNPHFFFLPPLADNPWEHHQFKKGTFNRNLQPVVRAFLLAQGAQDCSQANVWVYVAALERGGEEYHVDWHAKASNLTVGSTYRICVFSSPIGQVLGFLDVMPVAHGKKVTLTDIYTFEDDKTIPIKVRIEQGALCANPQDCTEFTVGAKGGNFTVPSQHAALSVPAGAIRKGDIVTIVVEHESPLYDEGCLPTDLVQSKGCYHFSSDPELYQFATNVRMEACVDVSDLTPGQRDQLLLYKYNETEGLVQLTPAATTLVDCTGFTAMAKPSASPSAGLAAAALRRLGRFAERFLAPQPLYAAMFGGVPKGLGGLGGSFSDVGGAVPEEGAKADLTITDLLTISPSAPLYYQEITATVIVRNIGQAYTGEATPFQVGLGLYWRDHDIWNLVGSFNSDPLTLESGAQATIQITIPCTSAGRYGYFMIKAEADVDNVIAESSETNNTSPELQFFIGSAGSGVCGSPPPS